MGDEIARMKTSPQCPRDRLIAACLTSGLPAYFQMREHNISMIKSKHDLAPATFAGWCSTDGTTNPVLFHCGATQNHKYYEITEIKDSDYDTGHIVCRPVKMDFETGMFRRHHQGWLHCLNPVAADRNFRFHLDGKTKKWFEVNCHAFRSNPD